jgi:hypothetical protein
MLHTSLYLLHITHSNINLDRVCRDSAALHYFQNWWHITRDILNPQLCKITSIDCGV